MNQKLAILDKKVLTKAEISMFARMLNLNQRSKDSDKREQVWSLIEKLDEKNYAITEEQSEFGINWLKKLLFKSNGLLRNTKQVGEFLSSIGHNQEDILDIVNNFDRFEFVGFHEASSGFYSHFAPIYRTIGKNGRYFDYTARMWQTPEILGTGKGYSPLERALTEAI
jgi:hypothetical protein